MCPITDSTFPILFFLETQTIFDDIKLFFFNETVLQQYISLNFRIKTLIKPTCSSWKSLGDLLAWAIQQQHDPNHIYQTVLIYPYENYMHVFDYA